MTVPLPPSAVDQHYRSVDSAPRDYAIGRPASIANGVIVGFAALSMLLLTITVILVHRGLFHESRDLVFAAQGGERARVPIRLFVITFFLSVSFSLATNVWRRAWIATELVGGLVVSAALLDLASYGVGELVDLPIPVVGQQIGSALVALAIFPWVVLTNAHLPPAAELSTRGRVRWHAWWRLGVPLTIAFLFALWVEQTFPGVIEWMRTYALLGGVGPGIFLVQQVFALLTALIGLALVTRSRRQVFAPPLAVLIPAHNEAHDIDATIEAVDRAAARYDGAVHVYVVDNASTDDTVAVTTEAIAACEHLTGVVLHCDQPGKAIALNHGLTQVKEDFVVRIDADTVIGEKCLQISLRHFATPDVGVVGGLPLPPDAKGFFERVRTVEVLLRHGFFQVSLMGYDGIVGQPGMFVVYRREAFDEAGLLVQGMNGEDTDICLRFTSAGYRCLADPFVIYESEVPRSWSHMREQRVRWFRSIYHFAAHNRHAIFNRHSMAGSMVVPFQLVNAARRAMLLPLLVFGVLVFGVFRETFPGLHAAPLVATFLGLPMLVAIGVCLGLGRPRAVLYVPEYLVFRLIRSYFTLAAVLSLVFPPLHPRNRFGSWSRTRRARPSRR